jgi:hypothetical protein
VLDAIQSGSGTGTTPSSTTSATMTATGLPTSPTNTGSPTETPLPNIVCFTEDMDQFQYNLIKAQVVTGGGVLLENFANADVSFFAFFANLVDDQADFFANRFKLTAFITPNEDGDLLDSNIPIPQPVSIDNLGGTVSSDASVQALFASNGTRHRRIVAQDSDPNLLVQDSGFATDFVEAGVTNPFFPFHLQWLSNLWGKLGLIGLCKRNEPGSFVPASRLTPRSTLSSLVRDVAQYVYYDNSAQNMIDVFVIDNGFKLLNSHDVGGPTLLCS